MRLYKILLSGWSRLHAITRNWFWEVVPRLPGVFKTSQALAAIKGRDYVIPDDIKQLAVPTLAHRLMMRPESELRGRSTKSIVKEIVETTTLVLEK